MSQTTNQRRRYNDWLEDQVSKRQARVANEVHRLWRLSDRGIATPKEQRQLAKAQRKLRDLGSQLSLIRLRRSHRPSR
jgi:hypothetical protein